MKQITVEDFASVELLGRVPFPPERLTVGKWTPYLIAPEDSDKIGRDTHPLAVDALPEPEMPVTPGPHDLPPPGWHTFVYHLA